MPPNWKNRTMWTGDNLPIMRGMNSESVDLIYLDPPFNSNRTYSAPIGSQAAGAAFKDTWTLSDVDNAWHGEIADRQPDLYSIIDASGHSHGKGMKSYLIMMAVRLLEMRRVLKATGSLYLHCDPTASHYLKTLMDAILGAGNFRNEIVWYYRGEEYPNEHEHVGMTSCSGMQNSPTIASLTLIPSGKNTQRQPKSVSHTTSAMCERAVTSEHRNYIQKENTPMM